MLLELLTEDNILTGVEASDWREVARKTGQLLVDKGSVEPEFIETIF